MDDKAYLAALELVESLRAERDAAIKRAQVAEDGRDALAARAERLEEQLEVETSLRPEWTKGYTDESVAAQNYMSAMKQMWEVLSAESQTEAMGKLYRLVNIAEQGAWVKLSAPNMSRLKAQWQAEALDEAIAQAGANATPEELVHWLLAKSDELRRQAEADQ